MDIIYKIKKRIKYFCATRSSENYVKWLRSKGLSIGDNCYFQFPKTIRIDTTRPILVQIGNNCRFLENFTLLTHDSVSKVLGNVYHDFLPSSGAVTIGNNVYFAKKCTVLKGVSIGDNCIIGYGSTVVKSIPSNCVAVGSPAKVVCSLEDYYNRRKKECLEEAFELARIIYKKTGQRPTVEQMWEEFPFWLDGNQDDNRLRFSVKYQTRGYNEYWQEEHKAMFKSFDEFIDKALEGEV